MRVARLVWMVLLLGACAGDEDTDAGPALSPLHDRAFAFCHDVDRAWSDEDLQVWCPLLAGADPGTCEGLRAACDRAADDTDSTEPIPSGGCNDSSPESPSTTPTRAASAPPPPPSDPLNLSIGEALVQIVRWTVALVVAVVLVGLVALLVRAVLGYKRRNRPVAEPKADRVPTIIEVPDADSLPEAPSGDLLDAANRAHAEGRHEDAVLFARGAALRALGDQGTIRLHSSKTDREYVRGLRKDRERQSWLRVVVHAVERARWGGSPVLADQAKQALAAASKLMGVLLIGVVALLLAPQARADDYGQNGDAALRVLFQEWGYDASWRLRSVRSLDASVDVIVLDTADIFLEEEDGVAVRGWVESGGLLVIAGSLDALPELGSIELVGGGDVRVSMNAAQGGLDAPVLAGGDVRVWSGAHGEPWVVVAPEAGPAMVLVQAFALGDGGVIGIADDRFLTNGALVARGNGAMLAGGLYVGEALGMWSLPETPVLELATIGGDPSSGSPASALANARLLPLVLQLLLVLALVGLWRGLAFGPLRDPPAAGRARFADHAVALGRRFHRARASRYAASRQAELWLLRLGPVALQAAAERHGYASPAAADLVRRAQELADSPKGVDSVHDFKLVEELWRITKTP